MPGIGQIQDAVTEPGLPISVNDGTKDDTSNAKDGESPETGEKGETVETGGSSAVVAGTTACLLATLFSL